MPTQWKPDIIYFCGELDEQQGTITEPILVMFIETELRSGWKEGKLITISQQMFVLVNRELDRKTQMVTYQLKKLAEPSPLKL